MLCPLPYDRNFRRRMEGLESEMGVADIASLLVKDQLGKILSIPCVPRPCGAPVGIKKS